MASDGLLFKLFNKISKKYNTPIAGTMLTGVLTGMKLLFKIPIHYFLSILIVFKLFFF